MFMDFNIDISFWLNSAGLLVDMVGVVIIYLNSPKEIGGTYLYDRETAKKMRRDAIRRNKCVRNGTLILFMGFCLQLVSNFF